MEKRRIKRTGKIPKINVELVREEDRQAYREIKALAAIHKMTIQEAMLGGLHYALVILKRRTLPPNTLLRISKARGVVPIEHEK